MTLLFSYWRRLRLFCHLRPRDTTNDGAVPSQDAPNQGQQTSRKAYRRAPKLEEGGWAGRAKSFRNRLANQRSRFRRSVCQRFRTDPADYNVSVTDSQRDRGSVVFTAWVATVLFVVIPPLWIALALTSSRERSMHLVRRWARRVFAWCGCSLQITGLQHLEPERGAIIVANHSSYLDSVVLLAVITSDYRFVANHGELARPFVGLVLRKGRHLIVDRGSLRSRGACMQAMLECAGARHIAGAVPRRDTFRESATGIQDRGLSRGVQKRTAHRAGCHCRHRTHSAATPSAAAPG